VIDWHIYNESLVRRGEVVLDFDVIDKWNNELDTMNKGKVGASYIYQNSFIQLLGYMRVYFHLPYRQTEGVVRAHAKSKVPSIPDYSTIQSHSKRYLDIVCLSGIPHFKIFILLRRFNYNFLTRNFVQIVLHPFVISLYGLPPSLSPSLCLRNL
jgi:hypothetical protein